MHVWLSSILVLGYCHLLKLGCHRSGSFPYLNWRIVADQHWVLLCFRRFYCFWTFACLIGHRLGSYCLWICSIGSHHLIISDNYLFGVMRHFSKLFLVYFCYSENVPSSYVPVPDQDDLDLAGSYSCCTHLDQLSSFSSCFEITRHQLCLTSMNSIWPTTFFHHLVSLLWWASCWCSDCSNTYSKSYSMHYFKTMAGFCSLAHSLNCHFLRFWCSHLLYSSLDALCWKMA